MAALIHWYIGMPERRDGIESVPGPATFMQPMKVAEKRGDAFGAPGWEHESTLLTTKARISVSRACCGRQRRMLRIWHPPSQRIYQHRDAELGQAVLVVENLKLNEAEALQHLYTASFPIRFRVRVITKGKDHAESMPFINAASILSLELNGTTFCPVMKYSAEPVNLYSLKWHLALFGHITRMIEIVWFGSKWLVIGYCRIGNLDFKNPSLKFCNC